MSKRMTKYMKEKTLGVWCPKCDAKPGESCQGANGGWAALHDERKTNALRHQPWTAKIVPASAQAKAALPTGGSGNYEAWKRLSDADQALVMSRSCPRCLRGPGLYCVAESGTRVPAPHKERQLGQSFFSVPCPCCGAKANEKCINSKGATYSDPNYTHQARRVQVGPLGNLTKVLDGHTAAPHVQAPRRDELLIIGEEEDGPIWTDRTVILTESMAHRLAAHLRGEEILSPDVAAQFADLLHHIPTPNERAAMKALGLDEVDFFGLPDEERKGAVDDVNDIIAAYIQSLVEDTKFDIPQKLWDEAVATGMLT